MKTESPVRTAQLWTKPQSEEEYTADQFTEAACDEKANLHRGNKTTKSLAQKSAL
jgi:hypothetical protein